MNPLDLLVGLAILVGLVGVVVPVLPGVLLTWAAVAVWATERQDPPGWWALGVATVVLALGQIAKYVLPGRRLSRAGVPTSTTLAGAALGLVGFFVVPVVGLPLGFVLGVYLRERARLHRHDLAVASSRQALHAAGWSVLIELATGLLIAVTWLTAVLVVSRG